MKSIILKTTAISAMVLAITVLFAFTSPQTPWKIPAKYKSMKNEYKADKSLIPVGKSLYVKHCKSCHGKSGLGDGSKAATLKAYPGDFSTAEFQKQVDGVLYFKSFIGKDEMPNYEKKIQDEEDRWAVINFLRTMK